MLRAQKQIRKQKLQKSNLGHFFLSTPLTLPDDLIPKLCSVNARLERAKIKWTESTTV
jgi:hypothetical protein